MILGITPNLTPQAKAKNNVAFSASLVQVENSTVRLSQDTFKQLAKYAQGICGKDVFEIGQDSLPGAGNVLKVTHLLADNTEELPDTAHIVYPTQDPLKSITDWMKIRHEVWLKQNKPK